MGDHRGDGASLDSRRTHLPPLAPRASAPTSTRNRTAVSATDRPGRLTHRSRAGCWTCRGRKVKCDEIHPVCGPCVRLSRDCDWDHRWNFNDATTSTQGRHSNVDIAGSAVWDPDFHAPPATYPTSWQTDDLPEFAELTSDEERERKAETQRPGTFSVVLTPGSFHDLPEYTSMIQQSSWRGSDNASSPRGGYRSPRPRLSRSNTPADPNVVVLERFVDASPLIAASQPSASGDSRKNSCSEGLHRVSNTTPPYRSNFATTPAATRTFRSDDHLIEHFRNYVVPRLVQPQQDAISGVISQGSTKDVLDVEASSFVPLHHAMCAISALNLSYNGRSSLTEAMQHYHQALAAATTATSSNDLVSNGVFFRHFLLFIYDICVPTTTNEEGTDMWADHLNHLQRIAIQRHNTQCQPEPFAYTLWSICELDMYACLMGSGNCDFVRTILRHGMLPAPKYQIPSVTSVQTSGTAPFLVEELRDFHPILYLNQGVVLRTAKLAQTAQSFREEDPNPNPGTRARWQAACTQLSNDLTSFWQQSCPEYLGGAGGDGRSGTPSSPSVHAALLPGRILTVFQNAQLLYHAATIYARTSMFPGQPLIPSAHSASLSHDTETRVSSILSLASAVIAARHTARRNVVFPIFLAGVATRSQEAKCLAVQLIRAFEGAGIGQNATRTRRLLEAVVEEQRFRGPGGEVDWLGLARERGLHVVNCGL